MSLAASYDVSVLESLYTLNLSKEVSWYEITYESDFSVVESSMTYSIDSDSDSDTV